MGMGLAPELKLTLEPVDKAPMATNLQLNTNPDLVWSSWYGDHMRLYFDCGDAGFVSLTPRMAALALIELSRYLGSVGMRP